MRQKKSFRDRLINAGLVSILATCFFIPLSTSLMGLFAVLTLVFWIGSGRVLDYPRLILRNPVVFLSSLLFLLFALGLLYTPVPFREAVQTLTKYRGLLFIAAVIALLEGNDEYIAKAENSFVTGSIILMLVSYAMYFSLIPSVKYGNSILFHITHSYFMALLGFWSLQRAIDSKHYRYFWLGILVLTVVNIYYINPGRTGMIIFFLLVLLTIFQRLSPKNALIGLLVLCAALAATYYSSPNLKSRTTAAISEIEHYHPEKSRTSLGQRFDWYYNSVELIETAPVFGHGTGSFSDLQSKLIKNRKTEPTDNPHNEYLFIGEQIGVFGLLVFIALLICQLVLANRMNLRQKYLVQGIVLAMAAGCTMNSFLFDSHQSHFYAFMSALYFVSRNRKSRLAPLKG